MRLDQLSEAEAKLLSQFDYHAPTDLQIARITSLRMAAKNLALTIEHVVPPGPDKSAAIRKLREALMTANAGVVLGPEAWDR